MENSKQIYSYKDLIVWQKSMDLIVLMYELTDKYPKTEIYGLTSQSRRAAVSIPSNIAEGRRRGTRKDYRHFLVNSYASGSEPDTQIELAKRLKFRTDGDFQKADDLLLEVMKMLNKMISQLEEQLQ